MKEKILFMGTPTFSQTVLKALIASQKYDIIGVVTQPDRPVGRKRLLTPSPVKETALAHNIPVYQPEKLSGSPEMQQLLTQEFDLLITAAYGQFVPTKLLKHPKFGAINVHASLLPLYRGGAPIHYAIWQGQEETGVSIMYMVKEMDAGDILAQAKTPIGPNEDVGDLFVRLADLGSQVLLETLDPLFEGKIKAWPQDPQLVTYSPTISKDQEQINWQETAEQIHNHVRAFRPFPTTFTYFKGQRMKIWQGQVSDYSCDQPVQPGTILSFEEGRLIIQAGQGTCYGVEVLQAFGKKQMTATDYVNGIGLENIIGQGFTDSGDGYAD